MKVRWQVDDGYVGRRPQYTTIPDWEFEDDMDEADRQQVIDDYVQSDFEQKITWYILGVEQ